MGSAPHRWPPAKAESLRLVAKAGGATVSASRPNCLADYRRETSSYRGPKPPGQNSGLAVWAENFLFAGSSALLLLIAGLRQDHSYLSFFALTPFLYRILRGTPGESPRLGLLLGLSFFGASSVPSLFISPAAALVRLFGGTALFALYGCGVGWARGHWGFNPSIVALLWPCLDLWLAKIGLTSEMVGNAGFSRHILHSLAGLVGLLAVSAIIVFVNSLIAPVVFKALRSIRAIPESTSEGESRSASQPGRNSTARKVFALPEERAPPRVVRTTSVDAGARKDSCVKTRHLATKGSARTGWRAGRVRWCQCHRLLS